MDKENGDSVKWEAFAFTSDQLKSGCMVSGFLQGRYDRWIQFSLN